MAIAYKTGDIIFVPGGPGHIQMIYQGQADLIPKSREGNNFAIHAQTGDDFHIVPRNTLPLGQLVYRVPSLSSAQQTALRRIADLISISASYRKAGIGKLVFSSSKEGKSSQERVDKYFGRLEDFLTKYKINIYNETEEQWRVILDNLEDQGLKLVSKVTCAEATVLCYQLSARIGGGFHHSMALSARGTMPKSLTKYLGLNPCWKEISASLRPFRVPQNNVQGFPGFQIRN